MLPTKKERITLLVTFTFAKESLNGCCCIPKTRVWKLQSAATTDKIFNRFEEFLWSTGLNCRGWNLDLKFASSLWWLIELFMVSDIWFNFLHYLFLFDQFPVRKYILWPFLFEIFHNVHIFHIYCFSHSISPRGSIFKGKYRKIHPWIPLAMENWNSVNEHDYDFNYICSLQLMNQTNTNIPYNHIQTPNSRACVGDISFSIIILPFQSSFQSKLFTLRTYFILFVLQMFVWQFVVALLFLIFVCWQQNLFTKFTFNEEELCRRTSNFVWK